MSKWNIDLQARVPKQTLSRSGDQEVNRLSLSCGDPVTPKREIVQMADSQWSFLLSCSLHCFLQFLFFSFSFPSTFVSLFPSLFHMPLSFYFSLSLACLLVLQHENRIQKRTTEENYTQEIWNSIRLIWIRLLINEIYWRLDQSEKEWN